MKTFLLALFLLSFHFISAQDYKHIDSIVASYPKKFKSIESFASKVASDFKTDIEKTRAVYYWVANNIMYDYKSYRNRENGYKAIKVESELDYEKRFLKMQRKYAEKALKRNTAVCEGYSQILKFTLQELNIECVVIEGFAKTYANEIGRKRNTSNHAWNAVKINNKWHLIDATWSTGNKEGSDIFQFDDIYFFINPEKLILTHFPQDTKWQLLNSPVSNSQYFNSPIFYSPYYNSGLVLNKITKGLIKVKYGKKITLRFNSIDESKIYYYSFKNFNYSYPLTLTKADNGWIAEISFKPKSNTTLSIYDENSSLIKFKIILSK